MHLSRLVFDARSRRAHTVLRDAYRTHALLSRALPRETPSRLLFRVEPSRFGIDPGVTVLVQSRERPDWSFLGDEVGRAVCVESRVAQVTPRTGEPLRFRLRANPTVKRDGKRFGLIGEEDQIGWLARKGSEGGFAISSERVLAMDEGVLRAVKKEGDTRHVIQLKTVLFEGLLTVTDSDAFLSSLHDGIGPAKGIGCGLLSIARA
jgi:CRISPR system Cascade subunit CasE